jgi:hypothetical protein
VLGAREVGLLPTSFVLPRIWQAHHSIGPTPDAARQRAVQLYPQIASRLARKRDCNRADALLVAAYGRHALAKSGNITHLDRPSLRAAGGCGSRHRMIR